MENNKVVIDINSKKDLDEFSFRYVDTEYIYIDDLDDEESEKHKDYMFMVGAISDMKRLLERKCMTNEDDRNAILTSIKIIEKYLNNIDLKVND